MQLIVKNDTIPLKAIPEVDTILETQFMFWLANLLSLKSDQEDKVKNALPAVKKHCWSMGFKEVAKMFEMYVDGELDIKPVSNHFDRVLVGQIFQAYRKEKKTKPVKKDVDKEKRLQDKLDIELHFDQFLHDEKIPDEALWIATYLDDKQLWDITPKEKSTTWKLVKDQIPKALYQHDKEERKDLYKRMLLKRYFQRLQAKGKHIKDLI